MNVDYHLYNVMLDYVDCNIQAYILYNINANNTILFYMLYMIILVCTLLHKAFCFSMRLYITRAFFSVYCSYYTFCLMIVYYLYIYTTLQNI